MRRSLAPSLPTLTPGADLMILWCGSCSFPDERWRNIDLVSWRDPSTNSGK